MSDYDNRKFYDRLQRALPTEGTLLEYSLVRRDATRDVYAVLWLRKDPVFFRRPYVTHRVFTDTSSVAFDCGHYDMGLHDAVDDYVARGGVL